jgi:hypothetical protein
MVTRYLFFTVLFFIECKPRREQMVNMIEEADVKYMPNAS